MEGDEKEACSIALPLPIKPGCLPGLLEFQEEALQVIKTYCKFNPLIKISEDDMLRLFEKELPHNEIFDFFRQNSKKISEFACIFK